MARHLMTNQPHLEYTPLGVFLCFTIWWLRHIFLRLPSRSRELAPQSTTLAALGPGLRRGRKVRRAGKRAPLHLSHRKSGYWAPMGELHHIKRGKSRKLGEVV